MFYGKLPIVFLSTLASNQDDSTNCKIATYILANLDEIKTYSINKLAEKCFVSISSISRFCRDVGLKDYSELRELIIKTELNFELYSQDYSTEKRIVDYVERVQDSLDRIKHSVNPVLITKLTEDLIRYDKVAIFGLLKAETVAMNLQSDLLMLGKITTTKVQYCQQFEYLEQADERDLIIIFSFTGIYFDYSYATGRIPKNLAKPKIYFITSDKNAKKNQFLNEVIYFESIQDQASHPYQLQTIAGLIAQNYAYAKLEF
jgi:DNA-binding MurR/RpiR family transcriptional regulator